MSICSVGMKIVIPFDGSEHAARALETAVQMAKRFNGKITLIHVVKPLPRYPLLMPEFPEAAVGKAITKAGEKLLAEAKERVEAEGVKVETLLKIGHVVGEITKACKEGEFDLVVMGARGIGSLGDVLLGSVSHGVINHANLPVLVVK